MALVLLIHINFIFISQTINVLWLSAKASAPCVKLSIRLLNTLLYLIRHQTQINLDCFKYTAETILPPNLDLSEGNFQQLVLKI